MAFFPLVIQVSEHMSQSRLPVSDMTCLWMLELETTANLFRQQLTYWFFILHAMILALI